MPKKMRLRQLADEDNQQNYEYYSEADDMHVDNPFADRISFAPTHIGRDLHLQHRYGYCPRRLDDSRQLQVVENVATIVEDVIVGGGTAELRKVLGLLKLSRRTLHIARRGVVGGMAVSFVQMVCAATGVLPPFANAVLQECVDLSPVR